VLLTGCRLDRSDYLTRDAQLRECTECRIPIDLEVADGLVQTDHSFLNYVFSVGSCKKVRAGFRTGVVPVTIDEDLDRVLVSSPRSLDERFVAVFG
jgi:hypothetical protein